MSSLDLSGCREYASLSLSRRRFLGVSGAAAAAIASAPAWLPRIALARDHRGAQRDVLISVFLRGGADMLSLCVPYTEANYYAMRPNTCVPPPGQGKLSCIDLGAGGAGLFGFPPAFAPLMPAYNDGRLLFVHATGSASATRSHFEEQRRLEGGDPTNTHPASGWLGRHLATVAPAYPDSPLRAVAIDMNLPMTLLGAPEALPLPYIDGFTLLGAVDSRARRRAAIETMHARWGDPMRAIAASTFQTVDALAAIDFRSYTPAGGAQYLTSDFGLALKSSAAMIKAQIGLEAIAIDMGMWDTHDEQGTVEGRLADLMADLATNLGAFYRDMTAGSAPSFTVACMSEFGRRVFENGSAGHDHGHASGLMLMGTAINGGRVLTQWPGLDPDQLFEHRDLQVTTDYRDILGEVIINRLGNPDLQSVFPGFTTYAPKGVLL
jgi:uncharacterized protein (DUF1501 family)